MDKSDKLFLLIRSLTKNEKIYFKKFTKKENNKYLKLFDAIEHQKNYDEDKILKKFAGERFTNQLHVIKNYLFNSILKSLRDYHHSDSFDFTMKDALQNVDILNKKGLTGLSEDLLAKAKRNTLVHDDETSLPLLETIEYEKKLIIGSRMNPDKTLLRLEELEEEERAFLEKFVNSRKYLFFLNRLLIIQYKEGLSTSKEGYAAMEKLSRDPLLTSEEKALSFWAKYWFNTFWEIYYYLKRDFLNSVKFVERRIVLLETHASILKSDPVRYINSLNSLKTVHYMEKNYAQVFSVIDKIKSVEGNTLNVKARKFICANLSEISTYNVIGEFQKASALIPNISRGLKDYEGKITWLEELHFYYEMAQTLFGLNDYRNSLKWINKILNSKDDGNREDLFISARILNIVVHFELDNEGPAESAIKSFLRFMETRKEQYHFEILFIQSLDRVIKEKNPKTVMDMVKELKKKIAKRSSISFDFHEIILPWLESKIQKRSFAEIVKEKTK